MVVALVMMAMNVNASVRTTVWEDTPVTMDINWPGIGVDISNLGSFKSGDAIIVTVSKADNTINSEWEWGPQVFIKLDWKEPVLFSAKSVDNGATNVEVKFTIGEEEYTKMCSGTQLAIQGMNVVVSKIEFESNEAYSYDENGKEIELDEWGQIYKSQLADYSGKDKLVFTYKIEGSTDYEEEGETKSVIDWGIGSIKSLGGNVTVATIPVKGIGEYNVEFTMDELQAAIDDTNTEYNTNGINFSMWSCKNAVGSRVSVVAYKANVNNIEIYSGGWASLVSANALDFSNTGLTVYTVTSANSTSATLEEVEGSIVPAGIGVLIKGEAGTYSIPYGDAANVSVESILAGSATLTTEVASGSAYVLSKDDDLFHLYTGTTIPAGKAYLPVSALLDGANGAKALNLVFEEATGISNIQSETLNNGEIYNLNGVRVSNPTMKGIYIQNGKKYIVK